MTTLEPDRRIVGEGTPAKLWQQSPQWLAMAPATVSELVAPGRRLVVIAPHPDDEILGSAGLLRGCVELGRMVMVIAVTDGEASHPGSSRWPTDRLRRQRRAESEAALAVLGLPPTALRRLGLPDGGISDSYPQLHQRLLALIGPDDVVLAPWRSDGHPDHEAVGQAAAEVCAEVDAQLLEVPIWGWHWARPEHPDFPWPRAIAVPLDELTVQCKRRAVRVFVSQLRPDPSTGAGPILPDWALARLVHRCEVFLR
ncbi:MAG: PIG-L deacetylase family protein [Jatrophihabitans sp.]